MEASKIQVTKETTKTIEIVSGRKNNEMSDNQHIDDNTTKNVLENKNSIEKKGNTLITERETENEGSNANKKEEKGNYAQEEAKNIDDNNTKNVLEDKNSIEKKDNIQITEREDENERSNAHKKEEKENDAREEAKNIDDNNTKNVLEDKNSIEKKNNIQITERVDENERSNADKKEKENDTREEAKNVDDINTKNVLEDKNLIEKKGNIQITGREEENERSNADKKEEKENDAQEEEKTGILKERNNTKRNSDNAENGSIGINSSNYYSNENSNKNNKNKKSISSEEKITFEKSGEVEMIQKIDQVLDNNINNVNGEKQNEYNNTKTWYLNEQKTAINLKKYMKERIESKDGNSNDDNNNINAMNNSTEKNFFFLTKDQKKIKQVENKEKKIKNGQEDSEHGERMSFLRRKTHNNCKKCDPHIDKSKKNNISRNDLQSNDNKNRDISSNNSDNVCSGSNNEKNFNDSDASDRVGNNSNNFNDTKGNKSNDNNGNNINDNQKDEKKNNTSDSTSCEDNIDNNQSMNNCNNNENRTNNNKNAEENNSNNNICDKKRNDDNGIETGENKQKDANFVEGEYVKALPIPTKLKLKTSKQKDKANKNIIDDKIDENNGEKYHEKSVNNNDQRHDHKNSDNYHFVSGRNGKGPEGNKRNNFILMPKSHHKEIHSENINTVKKKNDDDMNNEKKNFDDENKSLCHHHHHHHNAHLKRFQNMQDITSSNNQKDIENNLNHSRQKNEEIKKEQRKKDNKYDKYDSDGDGDYANCGIKKKEKISKLEMNEKEKREHIESEDIACNDKIFNSTNKNISHGCLKNHESEKRRNEGDIDLLNTIIIKKNTKDHAESDKHENPFHQLPWQSNQTATRNNVNNEQYPHVHSQSHLHPYPYSYLEPHYRLSSPHNHQAAIGNQCQNWNCASSTGQCCVNNENNGHGDNRSKSLKEQLPGSVDNRYSVINYNNIKNNYLDSLQTKPSISGAKKADKEDDTTIDDFYQFLEKKNQKKFKKKRKQRFKKKKKNRRHNYFFDDHTNSDCFDTDSFSLNDTYNYDREGNKKTKVKYAKINQKSNKKSKYGRDYKNNDTRNGINGISSSFGKTKFIDDDTNSFNHSTTDNDKSDGPEDRLNTRSKLKQMKQQKMKNVFIYLFVIVSLCILSNVSTYKMTHAKNQETFGKLASILEEDLRKELGLGNGENERKIQTNNEMTTPAINAGNVNTRNMERGSNAAVLHSFPSTPPSVSISPPSPSLLSKLTITPPSNIDESITSWNSSSREIPLTLHSPQPKEAESAQRVLGSNASLQSASNMGMLSRPPSPYANGYQ